jgi:hypothetical protein
MGGLDTFCTEPGPSAATVLNDAEPMSKVTMRAVVAGVVGLADVGRSISVIAMDLQTRISGKPSRCTAPESGTQRLPAVFKLSG